MSDAFAVLPVAEGCTDNEIAELDSVDDTRASSREITALLVEICAVVAASVAESAGAVRSRSTVPARDRVLIPEVRVGHLVDIIEGLRPKMLSAAADACGMGASRLASMQCSIASKMSAVD